jgi:hypothetical protein
VLLIEQGLWPDPTRKEQQARKSMGIARAMVESGDHDAAVEQVRTALSLTARWRLLEDGRFPLARAELPAQLEELRHTRLAIDLDATIHDPPSLHQLGLSVKAAYDLLRPAAYKSEARRSLPSRLIRPADPPLAALRNDVFASNLDHNSKARPKFLASHMTPTYGIARIAGANRGQRRSRNDSRTRTEPGSASMNCTPSALV